MLMGGCYRWPALAVELTGVRSNRVPAGPVRGAGRPEAALLTEAIVEDAARELALDPVELRRKNFIREFPHTTHLGYTYDSGNFDACLDRALALARPERSDGVGTGVGMYVERAGGQWESARARVLPGGRIEVASGSSPQGQGHATTFAQIAADELGVGLEDVEVRFGEIEGVGTFASRSTAMGGSAVKLACADLREQAARRPWQELAGLEASARFESPVVFSSGAYCAVVEVERATGRWRVLRLAAADDAGRLVNPLLAEGQVLGGTVMALGECLTEEARWDELEQPATTSFAHYHPLTAADVPAIETAFLETLSPFNPLGAKGIGEAGAIGALAAVANALADALSVRIDPPVTAAKVWQAAR
jgi:carbon-monoxide dehydrogenase large subunit